MFGSRRVDETQKIDWPALRALLEDDDRRAVVESIYPVETRESFLKSLRRVNETAAAKLLTAGRQLHAADKLVDRPTVAVAGMLNSGKTSLVSTFLSEHGRKRTLRGTNNEQGTHRFVLWLPQAWREDHELWGLLLSRIGDVVGNAPEMLAEDATEAHAQYNNRSNDQDALSIPLVATDPRLDEIGIGLLDCPDIVSDEAFGLGSPEARRDLLGKAATFCSAFVVVSSAESSRDATLGDLMRIAADLMPGIPRMLAVNKVRPRQTPDQVLTTFGPLARNHGIDVVYAAYDFDVPASRPYIPNIDPEEVLSYDPESDPSPVFFSVSPDADDNPPAAIEPDRMLAALPSKLDRGQLFEKFRVALESGLRSATWDGGLATIGAHAANSIKQTELAQECLLNAALEFFAHRQIGGEVIELRLHQSERIVRQLSESFAATAPWYARWGVKLNSATRRIFGGASDFIKQLTPTAIAKKTAGEIKDKFRKGEFGGLLTPDRLQAAIDRFGGPFALSHWFNDSGKPLDEGHWGEANEAAINRFERDDFTLLDPKRLDEAVAQMWANVPMHKKVATGLTPLAASLAAFGGVLMLPFDFGATTLVAYASIPELLAATGLATLSTLWAGNQNTRNVGQQAARQQLCDFHAVLCDTFGVNRPEQQQTVVVNGNTERLPISQIPKRDPVGQSLSVFRVRDEFRQELERVIPQNEQSGK